MAFASPLLRFHNRVHELMASESTMVADSTRNEWNDVFMKEVTPGILRIVSFSVSNDFPEICRIRTHGMEALACIYSDQFCIPDWQKHGFVSTLAQFLSADNTYQQALAGFCLEKYLHESNFSYR